MIFLMHGCVIKSKFGGLGDQYPQIPGISNIRTHFFGILLHILDFQNDKHFTDYSEKITYLSTYPSFLSSLYQNYMTCWDLSST